VAEIRAAAEVRATYRTSSRPPAAIADKTLGACGADDSGRSIPWVMVSFTALPTGSSSMMQRPGPSALSSGFHSFCHRRG